MIRAAHACPARPPVHSFRLRTTLQQASACLGPGGAPSCHWLVAEDHHAADHHHRGLLSVCVAGGYLGQFKPGPWPTWPTVPAGTPGQDAAGVRSTCSRRRSPPAGTTRRPGTAQGVRRAADPRGGPAATEPSGEAIDDLNYRLAQDGVSTSETGPGLVLPRPTPVPPDPDRQVDRGVGGDGRPRCERPRLQAYYPSAWEIDVRFAKALYAYIPGTVRLVKEGDHGSWTSRSRRTSGSQVDRLIANHKDYVNAFKKVSEEVRTEPDHQAGGGEAVQGAAGGGGAGEEVVCLMLCQSRARSEALRAE